MRSTVGLDGVIWRLVAISLSPDTCLWHLLFPRLACVVSNHLLSLPVDEWDVGLV